MHALRAPHALVHHVERGVDDELVEVRGVLSLCGGEGTGTGQRGAAVRRSEGGGDEGEGTGGQSVLVARAQAEAVRAELALPPGAPSAC